MVKTKIMEFFIKLFCGSMILFYLLWDMFHDESSTPGPIKFERALLMIAVAFLCNFGFFLSSGRIGSKFKKTTVALLLIAAFFNLFMFASIAHSPLLLVEEWQWDSLKVVLAWGSVLFSVLVAFFVVRKSNDSTR